MNTIMETKDGKMVKLAPIFCMKSAAKRTKKRKDQPNVICHVKKVKKVQSIQHETVDIVDSSDPICDMFDEETEIVNYDFGSESNGASNSNVDLVSLNESDEDNETIIVDSHCLENKSKDSLWTSKYIPLELEKLIGHEVAFHQLKNDLLKWNMHSTLNSNDDSDDEKDIRFCVLITGPVGIGKTSLVYCVAQFIGFKVFEINCSSKRNKNVILHQLSEATKSHHITSGRSETSFSNNLFDRPVCQTDKHNSVRANTLLQYFSRNNGGVAASRLTKPDCELIEVKADVKSKMPRRVLSLDSNSLILFDDADIVCEEHDKGFWSAVNTLIEASKKPIILTSTGSVQYITAKVNNVKVICLERPSKCLVAEGLKWICNEELEDDACNIDRLMELADQYNCDIRRCINHIQFREDFNVSCHTSKLNSINSYEDILKTYNFGQVADVLKQKINYTFKRQNNSYEDFNHSTHLGQEICDFIDSKSPHFSTHLLDFKRNSESASKLVEDVQNAIDEQTRLPVVSMDYLPYLSIICHYEDVRRHNLSNSFGSRRSRQLLHYFDSIPLLVKPHTIDELKKFYQQWDF